MNKSNATHIFESLSSGIRLDIYRLLVKAGPDGLVAGDIASVLALPANNTSFHLKTLTQAGLLSATQEGRFQRYRANMGVMTELIDYLTAECCTGNPDQCADISLPTQHCCEPTVNETSP
jgi:ArsR family transcriptional regulator